MKQTLTGLLLVVTLITFSACSNVGTNFNTDLATQIQKGKTTQADIEKMFGRPYKTGVQNAHPAWVYEYDQYRAIGADSSKDLVVVFNDDKTVRTYQIMSTYSHEDGSGSHSGNASGTHSGHANGSGAGSSNSHGGSGAGSHNGHDGSGKDAGHAKSDGMNNYNCGSCNTTYKP